MRSLRTYISIAISGLSLLFASAVLASPQPSSDLQKQPASQAKATQTAAATLEAPRLSLRPIPAKPLTCMQSCDRRAEASLKTCLLTVRALKSDPNWMDDTLSPDTCGKAAVTGADQCRKKCGIESVTGAVKVKD